MTDSIQSANAEGGTGHEPANTPQNATPSIPDFKGTKHKVKVDDRELEVPYEELISDYQLKKSSTKRFQEASEMMKQANAVESLLRQAQSGDLSWLKGIVPQEQLTKWAESELLQHIEYESLSEPEKRAIKAEKAREELEKKWNEREENDKQSKMSSLNQQAEHQIDLEIAQAVKEIGHDSKITPRLVKRIAEQIEASLEHALGLPPEQAGSFSPMSAKIASERAFKGFEKDVEEFFNIMPPDKALKYLPPKIREAIRKADVSTAQSQLPFGVRNQTKQDEIAIASTPAKSKLNRMSTDEYFKRLDKAILR